MNTETTPEIELLAGLRAELTEYEVRSEVRENVAGLAVFTDVRGVFVWVFVSYSGRYFSWDQDGRQHPVNDMPGAARRIAEQVRPNGSGVVTS
ncbi:hypothetical protein E1281_03140 [Actinomadura sp. KC345]|uniref:hypothetical protein n=1 Tax=Actinomadura sp. KC345 TaxID=2530371 RepID=UPI00104DA593|nr:hypothetical protein [Actinomadura sp. KC345]TDC57917.1 hypothetical protein E1281_03140 [Actinomadura sp. KC345]